MSFFNHTATWPAVFCEEMNDCLLEFGVYLTEFTVDTSVVVEVRQLASLLLKQYVEVHWSQHSEKFRQPETTERVTC